MRLGRGKARIGQYPGDTRAIEPCGDDPACVRLLVRACRRIDSHNDALQIRHIRTVDLLQQWARPQGVGVVLDQFTIKFLSAETRSAIEFADMIDKARGEVRRILFGSHAPDRNCRIGDHGFQERQGTRRRRNNLTRLGAEPQSELQHVPALLQIAPFRQFVTPGGAELRAAQAVRILRGEHRGSRAIGPEKPAAACFEARTFGAGHRHDPRRSVDHDFAHVGKRFADKCDIAGFDRGKGRKCVNHAVDPFCTHPCLAGAAPAEYQPCVPFTAWRLLCIAPPDHPFPDRGSRLPFVQIGSGPILLPAFPQVHRSSRQCASGRCAIRRC